MPLSSDLLAHARAFVFDAYGTVFDVHSAVARHTAAVGPEAARLSEIWRAKPLEYSWSKRNSAWESVARRTRVRYNRQYSQQLRVGEGRPS